MQYSSVFGLFLFLEFEFGALPLSFTSFSASLNVVKLYRRVFLRDMFVRPANCRPNQPSSLVYTSSLTGNSLPFHGITKPMSTSAHYIREGYPFGDVSGHAGQGGMRGFSAGGGSCFFKN